jgi:SpoVK/Ycf46/Vps4 family AAA+-type ATPase
VRSGRIELWLETRLPDEGARLAILEDRCSDLPSAIAGVDVEQLAAASEGLSGADLKRVVEDGKLLFAFARSRGGQLEPATDYFLRAVETVRKNKMQYAAAEANARARHPVRPPYFDNINFAPPTEGMMGYEVVHAVQAMSMHEVMIHEP